MLIIIMTSTLVNVLIRPEVVGLTGVGEPVLVHAPRHDEPSLVDHRSEHGAGRLHSGHVLPLRLLVVVRKHLAQRFASPMKWQRSGC